jgi:3-phytase
LDVGNFGRFTNGPVWGEYLATELNLPAPRASFARGTNYAWGGARTGFGTDNNPITGTLVPTVGKQIEDYLSRNAPDASKLIILSASYNDIAIYNSSPATIVSNISAHISTLAAAGARHIFIPTLVPLGNSPGFRRESMNQTAERFNQLLSPQLTKLETELGIAIYQDDFYGLTRSVIANPSAFGLQNVRESAGQNRTLEQTYLYWDNYHFTTAAHRILADSAVAAIRNRLVPEPAGGLLIMLASIVFCRPIRLIRDRHR